MALPIWKDFIYPLNVESGVTSKLFSITVSQSTVYQGIAHIKPGETTPLVKVNDVLAGMMPRGLTFLGMTDTPVINFAVLYPYNGLPVSYANTMYADWSYDPDHTPTTQGMNFPICDILLPGQWVPGTCTGNEVEYEVLQRGTDGDFNLDFNSDFLVYSDTHLVDDRDNVPFLKTEWLNLRDYPTAVKVTIWDEGSDKCLTYRVGGGCKQYALYYVNAYGGWDTLAVLGNTKVRDTLKHYTTEQVYSNRQTHNRGKVNYVNEVTRAFTFNTHPLNEDQASRMHHLLNSPHVYLHDVLTDHVYPIVLTGNTTEHSKGPGLHSYTIEAELAQTRIRR